MSKIIRKITIHLIILFLLLSCSSSSNNEVGQINGEFKIIRYEGIDYIDFETNTISRIYDNKTNDYEINVVENTNLKLVDNFLYFMDNTNETLMRIDINGQNLESLMQFSIESFQSTTVVDYIINESVMYASVQLTSFNPETNDTEVRNEIVAYDLNNKTSQIINSFEDSEDSYSIISLQDNLLVIQSISNPDIDNVLTLEQYNQADKKITYEKYIKNHWLTELITFDLDTDTILSRESSLGEHSVGHINDSIYFVNDIGFIQRTYNEDRVLVPSEYIDNATYVTDELILLNIMYFDDDYVISNTVFDLKENKEVTELKDYTSESGLDFYIQYSIGDYLIGNCREYSYCFIGKSDFLNQQWDKVNFNNFNGFSDE